MNRMARWMIRLYPASWRARYGDEVEALLSDTGADARIVGDLARGGIRMQLKAWPFPLLAFVLGLAGVLLGAGVSLLIPNTYRSQATLRIESEQSRLSVTEEIARFNHAVLSRSNLARIVNGVGLYRVEQRTQPLEDVIDDMRRAVRILLVSAPAHQEKVAFNIQFDYRDGAKARQAVAALVSGFQEEASNSAAQAGSRAGNMIVVDPASLPINPVSPTNIVIVAVGFLVGILLAFLLRMIFRGEWIRRRFALAACAIGLAGVIFALFAQAINRAAVTGSGQKPLLWTNHFRSRASFALHGATAAEADAITDKVLSRTSLVQIVEEPRLRLYASEQATTPLEDILQSMKNDISVERSVYQDGAFLTIAFEYRDRFKAQQALTALLAKFRETANQRLSAPAAVKPAPVIEILDRASTPIHPVKPNRYKIAGLGGIGGVFLAGIVSLLRRRWKPEPRVAVNS
jgi:capsular polysaccharide biosynthesis protein